MLYDNFYVGMDDNGYDTYNQSSFAYLKHINVHNKIGLAECEFELQPDPITKNAAREAGYVTADLQGNILIFSSKSGKVYHRGSGSFSVFMTHPDKNAVFKGALFYNGIFYWVSYSPENGGYKVGWMRGLDKSSIIWFHSDMYLSNIAVSHVPIYAWYTKLYIGGSDSAYVIDQDIVDSKITPGKLTKTQLNLPFTWAITDLRDLDVNLIFGAIAESNGALGQYRRFTDSFQNVDRTDSPTNVFFGSSDSNMMFALVGHSGDIIHYTGSQAVLRKRIPHVENIVPNPYVDAILDGRGLVAVHGKIFAYHQRVSGHPFALTHAFTCTGGEDAEIISIMSQANLLGNDQLFVSWEKGSGENYKAGLDCINFNKRATGLIVTPITQWYQESSHDERSAKIFVEPKNGYMVHYHQLPRETSIDIKVAINEEVADRGYQEIETNHYPERMMFETKSGLMSRLNKKTRLTQALITLKPFENQTPVINAIELM